MTKRNSSNKDYDNLMSKHDEVSKRIQSTMYFILLMILYFSLILGVSDTSMIQNNWFISLPFFNTNIDKSKFLILAPAVLYVLFLYIHAFIEHKIKIEKAICKDDQFKYIDSIKKHPALFNLSNKLPKYISSLFIYIIIPTVTLYFFIVSFKYGSSYIIVGIVTIISIVTSSWKYLRYTYKGNLFKKLKIPLVISEFLLLLCSLLVLSSFIDKPKYKYNVSNALLAYKNLSFQDLSYTNLTRTNLTGATLVNANLSNTNLSFAYLKRADLKSVFLKNAICERAKFDSANISEANISNSYFFGAKMRRVNMKGTFAEYSNFEQVDFGENAILVNTQFYGSMMEGAGMNNADLATACLRSDLSWAVINRADLTYANAVGTKMVGTKLKNSNLFRISFKGAVLIKAELMHANLTEADLHTALLHGTKLDSAKLIRANLTYAQFNSINTDNCKSSA